MEFPKIVIDLRKIRENCEVISRECKEKKISITGITKCFCARPEIAKIFMEGGIDYLGDSRLYNLKKIKDLKIPKVLIRTPMISTAKDVIKYADISLNSELEVIKELNRCGEKKGKKHKIILMVELGDLREGVLEKDIDFYVESILKLPNIILLGVGVNLTCYGGIIPDENNLGELIKIARGIEKKFGISLEMVTGGNSSSYYLLQNEKLPHGITNLRLGESIILGRETTGGNTIKGCHDDAFILSAEIIELKTKKSIPEGKRGKDAFGNIPEFKDKGEMLRGILAIGKQDTEIKGMIPIDKELEIIGASSDHLIIDFTKRKEIYKVGDIIKFKLDYASILRLMTSEYINKEYKYE